MGVVNFTQTTAMVIGIINADSTNSFPTLIVDSDHHSLNMIKEAVLVADADVIVADIDNPLHIRQPVASGDLNNGDSLGGLSTGKIVQVEIKIAAADSEFVSATKAPSVDQIRRWRRNLNNIYGPVAHDAVNSPLGARYAIEGNKFYLTGTVGRVWRIPPFVIDRSTPACQSDESYTSLVRSGAVVSLYKEGMISDELFKLHNVMLQPGLADIRRRAAERSAEARN